MRPSVPVALAAGETAILLASPFPAVLKRLLEGEGVQRDDRTLADG